MLRLTDLQAAACRNFIQRHRTELICCKPLVLVTSVVALTLLSQQPVGGQPRNAETEAGRTETGVIESRAHYSFSVPASSAERTGSSSAVLIERLTSLSENSTLPTHFLSGASAVESDELEETVGYEGGFGLEESL